MGDHPTGMAFYAGIVTALLRRERTGMGGEVRASLLANGMWSNAFLVQAALVGAPTPLRAPREQTQRPLGGLYTAGDGRHFLLALTSEVRQWPAIAKAIGQPGLVEDPRFIDMDARRDNARALQMIFDEAFARQPLAYWRKTLDAAGLTFGIVGTVEEAAADEQARAAGILKPMADSEFLTVDSPFTITGVDKVPAVRHPEHGEHSKQILRDAGGTRPRRSKPSIPPASSAGLRRARGQPGTAFSRPWTRWGRRPRPRHARYRIASTSKANAGKCCRRLGRGQAVSREGAHQSASTLTRRPAATSARPDPPARMPARTPRAPLPA